MIVGKVTGSVVSTRKNENLIGNKFMIVEPVESMRERTGCLVAIDNIGAGIGEYVLRRKDWLRGGIGPRGRGDRRHSGRSFGLGAGIEPAGNAEQ